MIEQNKTKLLAKIRALAEQGVGGEKVEAEKLLAKLLKKYNLSEADLGSDEYQELKLIFKNEDEKSLIHQICYKVLGSKDEVCNRVFQYRYGKGSRSTIIIECTPSQATQIAIYYDFYRELWIKEKQKMLNAFFQKHELFGTGTGRKISSEEYQDLIKRMNALDEAASPSLRIEA